MVTRSILIIEDDLSLRTGLAEVLEMEGWQVLHAENGARGVETALSIQPAVILSDINMPVLDGYGVLETLRAHGCPTLAETFFFMTGGEDLEQVQRKSAMRRDHIFKKPFEIMELLHQLDRVQIADSPCSC